MGGISLLALGLGKLRIAKKAPRLLQFCEAAIWSELTPARLELELAKAQRPGLNWRLVLNKNSVAWFSKLPRAWHFRPRQDLVIDANDPSPLDAQFYPLAFLRHPGKGSSFCLQPEEAQRQTCLGAFQLCAKSKGLPDPLFSSLETGREGGKTGLINTLQNVEARVSWLMWCHYKGG